MRMQKEKRDRNNFINIILNKIALAKNFHQRVALNITSKRVLRHILLKFYLRKRHNELFLFIRVAENKFGNRSELHKFFKDIVELVPELKISSTQGHYNGWILHLIPENEESLVNTLRLISLLATPKDFYQKSTKIYRSYYNYVESSRIPIHIRLTHSLIDNLQCIDLKDFLTKVIYEVPKNTNVTLINDNNNQ